VTLVEDDQTLEVLAAPLQQLAESRSVLARLVVGLSDQRGIRAEDHAALAVVIHIRADLGVLELQIQRYTMCKRAAEQWIH